MLLDFKKCLQQWGSQYQMAKAIREGELHKLEAGVYSDTGDESELAVIQFKYPRAFFTMESAYFYHNLTDVIPESYALATASNATAINDPRVKQYYMPDGLLELGETELDYCGDVVRAYNLERLVIETARMKCRLPSDMYREVVNSLRARRDDLDHALLAEYIVLFPKRDLIERIVSEEII